MPISGFGSIGSGADTDTEPPTKYRTTQEKLSAKYGKGRRISDSEHSGMEKPQSTPNRRSTRSTSKARQAATASASQHPPLPVSTTMSSPGKRGRPLPPSNSTTPRRSRRSVSPRKPKIIADSPPPEHRMEPFPPKRAPMTVSDKPAVLNRYGEKVPAPVEVAQKLRQAINFLSDEGVENCGDFEDKLNRLDRWIEQNHQMGDGVFPEGEQDTDMLYRRVKWMIWVHKNRIAEGAEQWFSRNQFPDSATMTKPIRPGKNDDWRVTPDGVALTVPPHPKLQYMLAQDQERLPKERAEKAAAAEQAAKFRSTKAAAAKNAKAAATALPPAPTAPAANKMPTLPYPEVWHRKEASRFPYGETPYMEQVMSKQITADLARGREAKEAMQGGVFRPWLRALANSWPFGSQDNTAPYDPWVLPEITDDDVWEADAKFGYLGAKVPQKRKARTDLNKSPPKRTRSGV